jgi:hypothetical protein
MTEQKVGGWFTVKSAGADVVAWWLTQNVFTLSSFQATPKTVCELVNNSSNLRCTSIFRQEKSWKMSLIFKVVRYFSITTKCYSEQLFKQNLHVDLEISDKGRNLCYTLVFMLYGMLALFWMFPGLPH